MPPSRSTTTYAILGLLAVRSWTTYELAKQVQRSLNYFWPRAERKLYDEPKRLVAEGLATAAAETTGKRPRTVYSITDAGRAELGRWLGRPSAGRSVEFEAMVKVFFADAGTLDQLRATLQGVRAEAIAHIEHLADLNAAVAENPRFPARLHLSAVSVRLQLDQEIAILRWVDWAEAQITTWVEAGDPGAWDARAALLEMAADARAVIGAEGQPARMAIPG